MNKVSNFNYDLFLRVQSKFNWVSLEWGLDMTMLTKGEIKLLRDLCEEALQLNDKERDELKRDEG